MFFTNFNATVREQSETKSLALIYKKLFLKKIMTS